MTENTPQTTVFAPGQRVRHRREPEALGTVVSVEDPGERTEVAVVAWDDGGAPDPQWANKLEIADA